MLRATSVLARRHAARYDHPICHGCLVARSTMFLASGMKCFRPGSFQFLNCADQHPHGLRRLEHDFFEYPKSIDVFFFGNMVWEPLSHLVFQGGRLAAALPGVTSVTHFDLSFSPLRPSWCLNSGTWSRENFAFLQPLPCCAPGSLWSYSVGKCPKAFSVKLFRDGLEFWWIFDKVLPHLIWSRVPLLGLSVFGSTPLGYSLWMGPLAAAGYGGNTALGSFLVWKSRGCLRCTESLSFFVFAVFLICLWRSYVLLGARERVRFYGGFGPRSFESGIHGVPAAVKLGFVEALHLFQVLWNEVGRANLRILEASRALWRSLRFTKALDFAWCQRWQLQFCFFE